MAESQPELRAVFCEALDLGTPELQAEYLDRACEGKPELRARVEALLRAQEQASAFLHEPPGSPVATMDEPIVERPGTVIGPYKLLEQIGEGGFGVVFRAEQTQPVRRKVALKVLKPGMDTRQVVARFEAERQALAIMDHTNIAKVFDGGATTSGRPYFVMELVKGVPITEFCDQNHLTPRQRLELFLLVCQAVQHAHHKGIIHRDLKPSNILVSRHDTTPIVKVIDFGIAKALGQELTDKTLFTGIAQMIGTPLYMSPEQAGMSDLDIDTRSDIYSLGVLLYELLTGTTPFNKERFKQAAYDEIRRIIREEDPPKPSTRLSESKDSLPSISAQRQTEPAKLTKLVRGELDWIVMKALEKDRNRRYETANGFAMDVQRYLADEPVLAGPPSARYRLRKFVRRNRAAVAVAGLVLFFLVLLGSGIGWTLRDRAARQTRVVAQVDLILGEVERWEKEQKWPEALAVARRAETLTAGAADWETQDRVRQVLHDLEMVDRVEEIRLAQGELTNEKGFDNEPVVRRYAAAFRDYGIDVEALPAEESAARLRARPAVVIPLAATLDDWASSLWIPGNHEETKRSHEDAKRLWALAALVDPDPWRVRVRQASMAADVEGLVTLANSPETLRQPPQSQSFLGRTLWRRHPELVVSLLERATERHPSDFWIHFGLAVANTAIRPQRLEPAVRHLTAARALRPRNSMTWYNLGYVLQELLKLDEAIACYNKAIELNPKFALAQSNLGVALFKQDKLDDAIAVFRKAIALKPDHANAYGNLANALDKQGKLGEAVTAYKQAIALEPKNALYHQVLAFVLQRQGKVDEAIVYYEKAIGLDPKNAKFHSYLAEVLHKQGKVDEAIVYYENAVKLDPKYLLAHRNLAGLLWRYSNAKFRDPARALNLYEEAIELDPKHASTHNNLAALLANCADAKFRDPIQAVKHALRAVQLDPKPATFWNTLGLAHYRSGNWRAAIAALESSMERKKSGGDSFDWFVLAMAHWQLAEKEKARAWYDRAVQWMDKNQPKNEQMRGFRAEAVELLGMNERKD